MGGSFEQAKQSLEYHWSLVPEEDASELRKYIAQKPHRCLTEVRSLTFSSCEGLGPLAWRVERLAYLHVSCGANLLSYPRNHHSSAGGITYLPVEPRLHGVYSQSLASDRYIRETREFVSRGSITPDTSMSPSRPSFQQIIKPYISHKETLSIFFLHVSHITHQNATMVGLDEIQSSNDQIPTSYPQGLVAVFAGATAGIGETTLREFARHTSKPRIYIIGRSQEACDRLDADLKQVNAAGQYIFIRSDVSLLRNVDDVCRQIISKETAINVLFMSQGTLNFSKGKHKSMFSLSTLAFFSLTLIQKRRKVSAISWA